MKTIVHNSLNILMLGIRQDHQKGHISSTPQGFTKRYLITCFQTPFVCLTAKGKERGREGDCIIFEPGFPQWHTNTPDSERGFINDWVHIASEGMTEMLTYFDIPFNTIISSQNPGLMTSELSAIKNEMRNNLPLGPLVIRHNIESILIKMSRLAADRKLMDSYTSSEAEYFAEFSKLREEVASSLTKNWTSEKMAKKLNLSANRFSVLYRKFFNNSPIDDLLTARIELAQYYLLSSNSTLETISELCGFSNVYYFSQLFKKRVGCPPGKYRREARPAPDHQTP